MPRRSDGVLDRIRLEGNPVADLAAQVRVGDARFTVLTPRLLRLEWSPGRRFEDRATFAFPNRRAAVPPFEVRRADGAAVLDTGALVLHHTPDGRPFHAGNLSIELTGPPGTRWVPGTIDRHNLGGARRTVDRARGEAALEPGLVSRSGWAVVDDGGGVVFAAEDGWPQGRPDPEGTRDWYFFGHGHDFAAAVADYTRFGGPVPLVPRWVLGAWWSRYWPYADADVRRLVAEFRARGLPLDVFVLDMDWHTPGSWTGYSWNRELFPDPRGLLAWLHDQGLHTTLNLHPALGVQAFEDAYPAFARAMGADPESGAPVPFRIADREFVRHYFELLHHTLEDEGVDFWWMDWQQGRASELAGLDPLPWLNHLHFADLSRRPDRRPLVFSRWGGLGSHRQPVGFSGDAFSLWRALRFQPRYTAAGANVGYAWWSHDIGGHVGAVDPELYVRWVQFGALSPVLRLHSTNAPDAERLPWGFGDDVLELTRAAFRLRYELVPHLYTAARVAADTGAAPVRPTAWIAPEHDGAYLARHQFVVGDGLLAAPVVHPAEPSTGLATADAWLPPGEWIERTTGETFGGPRWVRRPAGLARVPQFVRPGTVLALAEVAPTTAAQPAGHLVLSVFAGADGMSRVYEDDGTSLDHRDGAFAWTTVTTSTPDPSRCKVTVGAAEGDLAAGPRRLTVRLPFTRAPARVTVDGRPHDGWRREQGTTVVEVGPVGRDRDVAVVVATGGGALSIRGPEHDAALRAADLRALIGDDDEAAVRALPAAHPSRAAAVARIGGPFVQVIEHTAPEEAAGVLGRVVVAAAESGPAVHAEARWTLERGAEARTATTGPLPVAGDGAVLDAPFAWDGTCVPARWAVEVTVRWGDLELRERHRSALLAPSVASWRVAVVCEPEAPDPREVRADLARAEPRLGWTTWTAEPGEIAFPELTAPFVLALREGDAERRSAGVVALAAFELTLPADREVALEHATGGRVAVHVDGLPVEADPAGVGPIPIYTLHPPQRRTAPVRLAAGRHVVVLSCPKDADLAAHDWYAWASVVDPAGHVLLDVATAAPCAPARLP